MYSRQYSIIEPKQTRTGLFCFIVPVLRLEVFCFDETIHRAHRFHPHFKRFVVCDICRCSTHVRVEVILLKVHSFKWKCLKVTFLIVASHIECITNIVIITREESHWSYIFRIIETSYNRCWRRRCFNTVLLSSSVCRCFEGINTCLLLLLILGYSIQCRANTADCSYNLKRYRGRCSKIVLLYIYRLQLKRVNKLISFLLHVVGGILFIRPVDDWCFSLVLVAVSRCRILIWRPRDRNSRQKALSRALETLSSVPYCSCRRRGRRSRGSLPR
mmetsp:Transcript_27997/g.44020  ORF Transcript_27997/g.44020 Transcript_27997/m.44020 type:complete len:273 (+) Transcript_27997:1654-2472(+)